MRGGKVGDLGGEASQGEERGGARARFRLQLVPCKKQLQSLVSAGKNDDKCDGYGVADENTLLKRVQKLGKGKETEGNWKRCSASYPRY